MNVSLDINIQLIGYVYYLSAFSIPVPSYAFFSTYVIIILYLIQWVIINITNAINKHFLFIIIPAITNPLIHNPATIIKNMWSLSHLFL